MPSLPNPSNPQACLARTAEALVSLDIGDVAKVLNCTMLSGCPLRDDCRVHVDRCLARFPADPLRTDPPDGASAFCWPCWPPHPAC